MGKQEYKFNEEKLLRLFCANRSDKGQLGWLYAPYRVGRYIVATDEVILIRVNADIVKGNYHEELPSRIPLWPQQTTDITIGRKDIQAALDNIKHMPPDIKKEILIDIMGWDFRPYYLHKILKAMKMLQQKELHYVASPSNKHRYYYDIYGPARFRIDENIEILLMPCASTSDSPVVQIKIEENK